MLLWRELQCGVYESSGGMQGGRRKRENSRLRLCKCNQLEANTLKALKQLGLDTTIDHITDFTQIAAYGVMTTPALVVDGKVVSFGKVLKPDEVIAILKKAR